MKTIFERKHVSASIFLSVFLCLFWAMGGLAHAQTVSSEGDYDYQPYTHGASSGVIITAYHGGDWEVTTPTTLGGQPVIAIGPGKARELFFYEGGGDWDPKAFSNTSVAKINISEGVLFIGEASLASWNLQYVSLPASLQELGGNPFVGESDPEAALEIEVAAGNSRFAIDPNGGALIQDGKRLVYWPTDAARDVAEDGVLSIPAGISHIGPWALNNYSWEYGYAFTELLLGEGITHIDDFAFLQCGLEELTLPGTLTHLGFWVADVGLHLPAGLSNLAGNPCPWSYLSLAANNPHFRIDASGYLLDQAGLNLYAFIPPATRAGQSSDPGPMPSSVKHIAPLALYQGRISDVTLPPALESIGMGAFADSYDWGPPQPTRAPILPDSVTSIGDYAFAYTDYQGSLPSSLSSLGKFAFAYCWELSKLVIPGSLKVIPESAFARNPGYEPLKVTFNEGLERIEKNAFFAAEVAQVSLPASLQSMHPTAFVSRAVWGDISPLTAYKVAAGNPYLKSIDGVLFSADGKTLLAWPQSKGFEYRVPEGTEVIGPSAFANSYLVGFGQDLPQPGLLILPASIKSIHANAMGVEGWRFSDADAYFAGTAPDIIGKDMLAKAIVFHYSSDFAASWEAKLDDEDDPDPTLGGYSVRAYAGALIIPAIARQDGITGDAAASYRDELVLLTSMQGGNTAGVTLRYSLDGSVPTADSDAVADGRITLTGGNATVVLRAFRSSDAGEQPCGPPITSSYLDSSILNRALNNDLLEFSVNPALPWTANTIKDYSGTQSEVLRSPTEYFQGQDGWLESSVSGPGVLSFWWKSEDLWSYLEFSFELDGVAQFAYRGEIGWQRAYIQVPAGQHSLRWRLSFYSSSSTLRSYYLDRVSWTPAGQAGLIYEDIGQTLQVVDYLGTDKHLLIPEQDDTGLPIGAVDALAFAGSPFLESITFPAQLSTVANFNHDYGLRSCLQLESIFFRAGPPDWVPQVPSWAAVYYPHDYDAKHGTGYDSWDYYQENRAIYYNYGTPFLPIAYPLANAPGIHGQYDGDEAVDSFTGTMSVSFSSDANTVVLYTIDGNYPTDDSLPGDPLSIGSTTTFIARAFRDIDGELVPCSPLSRRTFVNPDEFNAAVGLGMEGFSFHTEGDQLWLNKNMANANEQPVPVVATQPLRPGQSSSLFLDFSMEEEGLVSFKQFYSFYYNDARSSFRIFNAAGDTIEFQKTTSPQYLYYNSWYKHTLRLLAGDYTAVWTLTIPATDSSAPYIAIDDFRAGSHRCTLTLLSEPEIGGTTSAGGVQGGVFNVNVDQDLQIAAHESNDYLFTGWSDNNSNSSRTITIKDPDDFDEDPNVYTAQFVEAAFICTSVQPAGSGYIHISSGSLTSTTNRKCPLGQQVKLMPSSNSGYRFDHWLDDDDDPDTPPIEATRIFSCSAEDRGRCYTAVFVPVISVHSSAYHKIGESIYLGGGTVTGTGSYDVVDANTPVSVELSATPQSEDFAFLGWDDNLNWEIDEDEERNPIRVLQLTWADLAANNYSFSSMALFAQSAVVTVDYFEPGDANLGSIQVFDEDGNEIPLAELQEGKRFAIGTVLRLQATAQAGSRLRNWLRQTSSYSQDNSIEITVASNITNLYRADFIRVIPYQASLAEDSPEGSSILVKNQSTGAEIPLSGLFDLGQRINVTVTPPEYYRVAWHDDFSLSSRTFTIQENPADNIFSARLVPTYTIVLSKEPADSSEVGVSPVNARSFDLGSEASFYAWISAGRYWRFLRWDDGNTQSTRYFNPEQSGTYSFKALFERYVNIYASVASGNNYYAGTFSNTGYHSVSETPREVSITATPREGYRFDRWVDEGAGALADPSNPVRVLSISTDDQYIALTANFIKTYQVSVGIYPGSENFGVISDGALSDATIDAGSEISFTATPHAGGQFVKWWRNGYAMADGSEATQTIVVDRALNFQAEFSSEAEINIGIAEGQENWGCQAGVVNKDNSLASSGLFAVGYRYTIEARPAPNHRFVRWSDGNSSSSRSLALTEAGIDLMASFAQTATITMDFKTDPATLPEGISFPYMYFSMPGIGNYYYRQDNAANNTRIFDVGSYSIRYSAGGDWTPPPSEDVTLNVGDNLVLDRTFTLITKGTLTGYLSPSEIAGAWRVKGESQWQNSAASISIEAGVYDIEFQPVAGWLSPPERQVTVIANRKVSFNGIYSAVVPGVQLSFSPVEVSEAAGPNATIATLRRIALDGNPIDSSKALTIQLSVSEAQALLLPSHSIVIPAGRDFTQFPVGVIDNAVLEDFLVDENQNQLGRGRLVTLSGTVAMSASCNCNGKPTDGSGERPIAADLILWDDDGPALSVHVSPSTLPERDEPYAQALDISRNDELPVGDLNVVITAYVGDSATADEGEEIQFWLDGAPLPFLSENDPTAVVAIIPDGQRNVKIDVLAVNDGKVDGNQLVSIFADAEGYSPGAGWAMVTDLSFPDYSIKNLVTPAQALESDSVHPLSFTLFNGGNMDVPIGLQVPIVVHASRSNSVSNNTLLMSSHLVVSAEHPLPKGGSMDAVFNVPLDNLAPANDWRFCVVVNPNGALREVSSFDNQSWSDQFSIDASYVPLLDPIAEGTWILPEGSLELSGKVLKSATNYSPVAEVDVDVYVVVGDYRRVLETRSDASGNFSVSYTPNVTERGRVIVGACYPGTDTKAKQEEFDVLSFGYLAGGNSYIRWDVTTDTPGHFSLTLSNPNSTTLTGIQASLALPDPQLNLPVPELDGILSEFPDLPDSLAGGESAVVNYSITALLATPGRDYQRPILRFSSAEGAVLNIPVYFFAIPQFARLSVEPASIDTTMQIGVSRMIDLSISNSGAIETGPISITTPNLSWLSIASGNSMPSIPAGESATLTLQLRGDDSTVLGMPLKGAIAINAANAQDGVRLPFLAMAVSDDKGSLRISAVDESTYYEEDEPRLKHATVTVKNPYTGAILGSGNTGEDAFCIIEELPVGKVQVIISADKHESATTLLDIAPGQQGTVELFLSFQAISYQWDVVPTEIEDEYEVVLTVVYETNVPMPVVRTEMPTNFIDMLPGTTRLVNAVLTNEGLIAAHNVRLDFYDAGSFSFECKQPDDGQTLLPQQSSVLPVIVRRAASGTRAEDPCTTRSVTVYYYECGKDFKWHRYEKQMQLRYCPPSGDGGGFVGGSISPGVPYIGSASVTQPTIPPLPSVPESCIPCQKGLIEAAMKCGLGFLPVGCILGVVDAIKSLVGNYNKGAEGWIAIVTDGSLAGLGCVAEGTYGKFSNILGCIKGFMEACDGLDGFKDVGTTRGTRATGAPSWVQEVQELAYIGYRQADHHADALIEYYGDERWLEAETAQLSAFNEIFRQLNVPGADGRAQVFAEDAPELIAVLPDNLSLEDLATFVARWNRTMAYWQSLPGGEGAALPGDQDDQGLPIISLAKLLGINDKIEECEEEAKAAGYDSVHDLVVAQYAYTEEQSKNSSSVCAKVSLEIKQKISMTREAFDGTLTMTNGHETLPITALGLVLKVTNAAGEDCTDLFEVLTLSDKFNGITAIDGSGTLAAKATGSAMVRFIPERGAAPETPVVYNFGGTLTYINPFSDATATIELSPSTLTVNPSPSLQIHYFLQRDVLGDDPLTRTVIEPSYPAELSALVYNDGHGVAKNFRIDSGQPKIIDNAKGLLIDFALWDYNTEASMLNGQPNNAPLGQVNLGDIQPKSTGLAQWWLTSSLLGHFIDMDAKYSHLNSHGNPELSLIESVDIHELIRSGQALDRDTTIFLVNDFADAEDTPDTLWFQDTAQSCEVLTSNHILVGEPSFNLNADPPTLSFTIQALQTGWHYVNLDDPANFAALPGERRYEITGTTRRLQGSQTDLELPFRNCWQTDRTIPDGQDPINENRLHLIDQLEIGSYSYTLSLVKLPDAVVRVSQFEAYSSNNENLNDYIVSGDVDLVTVIFNTKIDPDSFSTDDMSLRRQGVHIDAGELAAALSIEADPDDEFELSYYISGLSAFTSEDAFYVLTVQCAGITDPQGFAGAVGKQLMWVRQHDFGGDNAAAPSLFAMERIVPEAGMEGEFDVKLSFLGNIDGSSVTAAGLRLKKNGQLIDLPAELSIEQDADSLGEFYIRGLGVLPAEVDFYSLRYDASGVKDVLGNTATGLRSVAWGNDVTPPDPIADLTLTPDTGFSANDRITQLAADKFLTLAGTLPELPCSYQLFAYDVDDEDGAAIDALSSEIFAPEEGSFAMSIDFNLPEGKYNLLLVLKDEAGNSTEQELSLQIDNTAPLPVSNAAVEPDTGKDAHDRITQLAIDEVLTFRAQASEVPCRIDVSCATEDGQAVSALGGSLNLAADADPAFQFAGSGIAEGAYLITVTITDAAGNSSSSEYAFLIDNQAPSFESFKMTPDTGRASDDFITQGDSFEFHIQSSEKPVIIAAIVNGLAQAPVQLDAIAFHIMSIELPEGSHDLEFTLSDLAGNSSSRQQRVVVDNSAPAAIGELSMAPDSAAVGDFITQLAADAQLTLSGKLPEKLLEVSIREGESLLASKTCVGDEQDFALDFPLAEGKHALSISITDQAGNSTTLQQEVLIDNTAPDAPSNLAITPDSGLSGDFITQLPEGSDISLSGDLTEKLLSVTVTEGDNILATMSCVGDEQNFVLSFPLAEGSHELLITSHDRAGNSTSVSQAVLIDNSAPAAMSDLSIAPDTGRSDKDRITSQKVAAAGAEDEVPALFLVGTLPEAGLKLEWFRKDDEGLLHALGELPYAQDENTALNAPLPYLDEGKHSFVLRLTDLAGNSSDNELAEVLVDDTAPEAITELSMAPDTGVSGDFITQLAEDAQLTLSGTLPEPLLEVILSEGETILASKICEGEEQSFVFSFPLAEGSHELLISISDLAGNRTDHTQTVIIDNTAPAAISDLAITPDSGIVGDFISQLPADAELTLSGKLPEPLLTVSVTEGENILGNKSCTDEEQAFALAFPLAEGSHELIITISDQAGNSTILAQTVLIDNTAPSVTELAMTPDSGIVGDFITQLDADSQLSLSGDLSEKLLSISISEGEKLLASKTCVGDEQDFTLSFPLAEGKHELSISITDPAGNNTILQQNLLIDNTAPTADNVVLTPDHGSSDSDGITWLADDESFSLAFLLSESPVQINLSYRVEGSEELVALLQKDHAADASLQTLIPVNLREAGSYTLVLSINDPAGNQSADFVLPLQIDATPLSVSVSQLPTTPGDEDSLSISFSAEIVEAEFSLDNVALSFDGKPCPNLTLNRLSSTSYRLGNLLELVDDDGEFELTISLDGLRKALSGLPAAGSLQQSWNFAYDAPDYAWQAGWNAVFLPFDLLVPNTLAGLAAMPRSIIVNDSMVMTSEVPLCSALWVFCADPDNAAPLRGIYSADQEQALAAISAGKWTFTGVFSSSDLPENVTAWEWRGNKYVRSETLQLGQAYWLFLAPEN
jgi:hypothetical protein